MECPKIYSLSRLKKPTSCVAMQSTPSHVRRYRAENGNLGKFGPTFRHVAVFAPKQCLYEKEARAMESPKMYSLSRCKKTTFLCGYVNTPSHVSQYRVENGNLGKFEPTFRHGAVFSPKQCSDQKEAIAMESPKIYLLSRCKKCTYLFGYANYPVSCKAV